MASPIPGYQIIRKIADGGMSSVYLAIQLSVGREVALKILAPELSNDKAFTDRFYREANLLGRLKHPNILSIYDIGHHQKRYYIAMEYLPNSSLKRWLKKQPLSVDEALSVALDINGALEYLHQQDYLHCDVKPDNIMLRADNTAVLTDFGIARQQSQQEAIASINGTPYYMSPEQLQGKKLAPNSDIYSLGIVLYEMLTGKLPFVGKDLISSAIKQINSPVPNLESKLHILQPLLNRMLAKRPGARFQNCNETKHALDFFEAQYLRKESQRLPLKLHCQLLFQRLKETSATCLRLFKGLHLSFRHGLVVQLSSMQIASQDIEQLSQTIEITHNSLSAQYLLYNDPIALALALNQAKQLLPFWLLALLLSLILGVSALLIGSDSLSLYLDTLLSPGIIYID